MYAHMNKRVKKKKDLGSKFSFTLITYNTTLISIFISENEDTMIA
jgi:hypothetical protein